MKRANRPAIFKGRHSDPELILCAVRGYLRSSLPFNVNTQPISDASTVVRPAMLRNLVPDHTLVLVNGKRRHRCDRQRVPVEAPRVPHRGLGSDLGNEA